MKKIFKRFATASGDPSQPQDNQSSKERSITLTQCKSTASFETNLSSDLSIFNWLRRHSIAISESDNVCYATLFEQATKMLPRTHSID